MGRPAGSQNKGKQWRGAFNRFYSANPDKMDELVVAAHAHAMGGETSAVSAMNFIRDTMDGKPAQALIGGDEDEPAVKVDTVIRRVIVRPDGHQDGGSVPPAATAG